MTKPKDFAIEVNGVVFSNLTEDECMFYEDIVNKFTDVVEFDNQVFVDIAEEFEYLEFPTIAKQLLEYFDPEQGRYPMLFFADLVEKLVGWDDGCNYFNQVISIYLTR